VGNTTPNPIRRNMEKTENEELPKDETTDTTIVTKSTLKKGTIITLIAILLGLVLSGIFAIIITKQNTTPTTYQLNQQISEQKIIEKDIAVKIMRNDPLAPKDYDLYMKNKASIDALVDNYRKAQIDINTLKEKDGIVK
jgi:hypothetical protein